MMKRPFPQTKDKNAGTCACSGKKDPESKCIPAIDDGNDCTGPLGRCDAAGVCVEDAKERGCACAPDDPAYDPDASGGSVSCGGSPPVDVNCLADKYQPCKCDGDTASPKCAPNTREEGCPCAGENACGADLSDPCVDPNAPCVCDGAGNCDVNYLPDDAACALPDGDVAKYFVAAAAGRGVAVDAACTSESSGLGVCRTMDGDAYPTCAPVFLPDDTPCVPDDGSASQCVEHKCVFATGVCESFPDPGAKCDPPDKGVACFSDEYGTCDAETPGLCVNDFDPKNCPCEPGNGCTPPEGNACVDPNTPCVCDGAGNCDVNYLPPQTECELPEVSLGKVAAGRGATGGRAPAGGDASCKATFGTCQYENGNDGPTACSGDAYKPENTPCVPDSGEVPCKSFTCDAGGNCDVGVDVPGECETDGTFSPCKSGTSGTCEAGTCVPDDDPLNCPCKLAPLAEDRFAPCGAAGSANTCIDKDVPCVCDGLGKCEKNFLPLGTICDSDSLGPCQIAKCAAATGTLGGDGVVCSTVAVPNDDACFANNGEPNCLNAGFCSNGACNDLQCNEPGGGACEDKSPGDACDSDDSGDEDGTCCPTGPEPSPSLVCNPAVTPPQGTCPCFALDDTCVFDGNWPGKCCGLVGGDFECKDQCPDPGNCAETGDSDDCADGYVCCVTDYNSPPQCVACLDPSCNSLPDGDCLAFTCRTNYQDAGSSCPNKFGVCSGQSGEECEYLCNESCIDGFVSGGSPCGSPNSNSCCQADNAVCTNVGGNNWCVLYKRFSPTARFQHLIAPPFN